MAKTPGFSSPVVIGLGALCLVALVLITFVVAQESQPDDETCLMCHDGMDAGLAASVHRLSSQTQKPTVQIACVSCHTGGSVHVEDPSVDNIGNPSRMANLAQEQVCGTCHQPHKEQGTMGFDPHIGQDLGCTDCHGVHDAGVSLLLDDDGAFCGGCHVSVVSSFRQRSNHPTISGNVTCMSCHDFTGRSQPHFGHGSSENCGSCHQEIAGPFVFEHQASGSFSTDGHGCVSCHAPHGSPNERLLNQPAASLCQSCHGTPPGHLVTHSGIGTAYRCIDCHSAVHGSNQNRGLLDPQLGSKIGSGPGSCFCHNVLD